MKIVKKIFKGILIFIGVIIITMLIVLPFDLKEQSEIKKIVIDNVDITKLEDGTYYGTYSKHRWKYTAKVTILQNKITNIDFTPGVDEIGKFSEELANRVIEKQSNNVDTVSGATVSSKAILKAIEVALKSGESNENN